MKTRFRLSLLSLLTACALAVAELPSSVRADDDDDHEQARAALQQHKALPLAQILDRIRPKLDGRIVGIEFEEEDGHYFYEIKTVTPDGRIQEIYVDARTAQIVEGMAD
jgi:uncharacterized membrane protein YkoI